MGRRFNKKGRSDPIKEMEDRAATGDPVARMLLATLVHFGPVAMEDMKCEDCSDYGEELCGGKNKRGYECVECMKAQSDSMIFGESDVYGLEMVAGRNEKNMC